MAEAIDLFDPGFVDWLTARGLDPNKLSIAECKIFWISWQRQQGNEEVWDGPNYSY